MLVDRGTNSSAIYLKYLNKHEEKQQDREDEILAID